MLNHSLSTSFYLVPKIDWIHRSVFGVQKQEFLGMPANKGWPA